jgi:hypothetical protein
MPSAFLEGLTNATARSVAWMEIRDPRDGRMYYFNKVTRKVQWRRPKGFVPSVAPDFPPKRRAAALSGSGAGMKGEDGVAPKKPRKRYTGHLFKQGGGTSLFGKKNWKVRCLPVGAACALVPLSVSPNAGTLCCDGIWVFGVLQERSGGCAALVAHVFVSWKLLLPCGIVSCCVCSPFTLATCRSRIFTSC